MKGMYLVRPYLEWVVDVLSFQSRDGVWYVFLSGNHPTS